MDVKVFKKNKEGRRSEHTWSQDVFATEMKPGWFVIALPGREVYIPSDHIELVVVNY